MEISANPTLEELQAIMDANNGNLYLEFSAVKTLPSGLIVKGNLDLTGSDITTLPTDLRVEGDIYLHDTSLTELPSNLKVDGEILFNPPSSEKKIVPFYEHPASYARAHNQLNAYRASNKENEVCKEAIESAISQHYQDNRLNPEAARQVVKQFGYERTFHVLAITVQQHDWDGRFSNDNKAWAATVPVFENLDAWGNDRNCYFIVNSHPVLVNAFLQDVRDAYANPTLEELQAIMDANNGNLEFRGREDLKSLPADLTVRNDLELTDCPNLTALPDNLQVGGNLFLSNCRNLTVLPNDLTVGGDFYLSNCTNLESLPTDLHVGGTLDIYNCFNLKSLPAGLTVGGNLNLHNDPLITVLPSDLKVEGKIIGFHPSQQSFADRLNDATVKAQDRNAGHAAPDPQRTDPAR